MRNKYTHFILFVLLFEVFAQASKSNHFYINKTGCFKTKGCIYFPDTCTSSDDCDYLVTYSTQKHAVAFELSSKNEYAGFGLNTKQAMDGTDAIVCSKSVNGSAAIVGHYLLHHHNTPSISKPTPSGLTEMAGAYQNGRIVCRFKRSFTATPPMKYNLNNYKYFFAFSRGKISESGGLTHHVWRSISDKKQAITSKGPVQQSNNMMVAIHAGLMLVAWIGFASVGIFTARYTKALLGTQTCCNVKLWFQLHRGFMSLTTLLTMAGVAVIFVYAKRWSKIAGWHAIIGIVVVSLATLQPIIALFRPSPESPNRWIFNGLHRCIAFTVFALALTNCYLGINLFNEPPLTNHLGFCVISTFIVAYIAVLILYELYILCYRTNKEDALLNNTEQDKTKCYTDKKKGNLVAGVVYSFVILAAIGICTTFIVLLALATEKQIKG